MPANFSNWYFFPDPCIKFYNLMTVYFILLILVIVFMNGSIIYIMSDRQGIHGTRLGQPSFYVDRLGLHAFETRSVNLFERRAAANWNIRVFKISLATSGTNLHIILNWEYFDPGTF